jgi:phage shock protein PspC (stress-responsive transcriptional regulator)
MASKLSVEDFASVLYRPSFIALLACLSALIANATLQGVGGTVFGFDFTVVQVTTVLAILSLLAVALLAAYMAIVAWRQRS